MLLSVVLMPFHRYFSQDEEAGRSMTQTLASIPPSQRATFSRIQASTRSAYHRSVNVRRAAEFRAHLSATQPGGSLTAHTRAHPRSTEAHKGSYGLYFVPERDR